MTIERKPILHGRDHVEGGADPIPGLGGGAAHEIQDEGTPLTDRSALNFVGAGVTASDDAGNDATLVTIAGGGGGADSLYRLGTTENRWYVPGQGISGLGLSPNLSTVNLRTLYPFYPSRDMTLDRLLVQVTGAVASSSVRLGIYEDDGNLYPSALLLDAGTVATATTGVKTITISQALTGGELYWVAAHMSHNAIQMRSAQFNGMWPLLGADEPTGTTGVSYGYGWMHTTAFAVLPDPFPASATRIDSAITDRPCVFVRGT